MSGSSNYKKQWYQKNRERILQQRKEYRQKNHNKVKEVMKRSNKKRRELDPELAKRRARGYALKRKYGITLEQYEELLEKQNRCCAICERHESEFKTFLAVDHSHRTKEIRGLLCTHCNYRLVARHHDGEVLRKIADYIEKGTGYFVPEKVKKRKKNAKTTGT